MSKPPPLCIHTVLTSNGNSYMNWQTRVMFATWKAAGKAEGPGTLLTAFTRVLHRSKDDELMIEARGRQVSAHRCLPLQGSLRSWRLGPRRCPVNFSQPQRG